MTKLAPVIRLPVREESFIDLHGLQAVFGYSERWWRYRMVEEGFPKHRWGAQWRFRRSEVEAWLEGRCV